MNLPPTCRSVVMFAAVVACLVACVGSGCGKTKKKVAKTIEQQRKEALAQTTPEGKAKALVALARRQGEDTSGAAETLAKAEEFLSEDGSPAECSGCLVEIAELYVKIGEKAPARKAIVKAAAAAEKIDEPVARAEMLAEVAAVQGAKTGGLGDRAAAGRTIEKAKAAADAAPERFQAKALAAVAAGCLEAGLVDKAGELVATLEERARSLENGRPKVEALVAAVNVHIERKDADAATALLAEAASGAKAIEGNENRAYALVSVALAMSDAGDNDGALALLDAAEKAASKVGDADAQKNAITRVREVQADIEKRK